MEMNDIQIYTGPRDLRFKQLVLNLLKRGNISDERLSKIMTQKNWEMYSQAFTSTSADPDVNYEMYEQLGDVTANKFIVWYMYRRFPQLRTPLGVKVVARLRINYGARQSFSQIGEKLGFWDYISASEEDRGRKKKDLLEDCVESFIGVTEMMIDDVCRPGVGHAVVYDILKSIFDEIAISLKYEDLYDSKTRLKELFDYHKTTLGKLKYRNERNSETGFFTAYAYIENDGDIGSGMATKLKDAEQKAAEKGIQSLRKRNISKPIPDEYKIFNDYE